MPEYTIEDYEKLYQYVIGYQQGDKNSADKIIEAFKNFLLNYINLITYGTYKYNDYSLKRFIGLYTKRDSADGNNEEEFKKKLEETSKKIQIMFSKYTKDEIKDELIAILLGMARKYKDYARPSFHNYVYKCFHYEAYRCLKALIKDPISRSNNGEYMDAIYVRCKNHGDLEEPSYDSLIETAKYEELTFQALDDRWIEGITCNEVFNCLTSFERIIIKAHYIDRETDENVANRYGVCRATINRKRLKAIKKLADNLKVH